MHQGSVTNTRPADEKSNKNTRQLHMGKIKKRLDGAKFCGNTASDQIYSLGQFNLLSKSGSQSLAR
jgi:hypothetical protein